MWKLSDIDLKVHHIKINSIVMTFPLLPVFLLSQNLLSHCFRLSESTMLNVFIDINCLCLYSWSSIVECLTDCKCFSVFSITLKTFIHNIILLCFESVERKTFLQSLARIGREKVHYRHDVRLNKNEKFFKKEITLEWKHLRNNILIKNFLSGLIW
jgi:hypothetical protein